MDFLISSDKIYSEWDYIKKIPLHLYFRKGVVSEREFIYDTIKLTVLADANISFINKIKQEPSKLNIKKNINSLNNGFVLLYNKNSDELFLFTDIFGFYPVFSIIKSKNEFKISTDFRHLIKFSSAEVNASSVIDLLLFNYIINEKTLLKDIVRLKGGSILTLKSDSVTIVNTNNFADNLIIPEKYEKFLPNEAGQILSTEIGAESSPHLPSVLTMSGGFDSRVLLAAVHHAGLDISTFTFGQPGSIEQETISPFINSFSTNHTFFRLDDNYLNGINNHLIDFLEFNLDNPSAQDLVHYSYIKNNLINCNLIAGYMGGELITGQSLGAGVTFTEFAYHLLNTTDKDKIADYFNQEIEKTGLFDIKAVSRYKEAYLTDISNYFYDTDKLHIIKFLLNEKYSKFFGRLNSLFRNHSNLIVPFMSHDYLLYLLNSKISILHTGLLNNPPTVTIKARMAYSKMIEYLNKPLADTNLDRLYRVKDLSHYYRLPCAIVAYLLNHLFDRNKKKFLRPHHYDLWYTDLISKHITPSIYEQLGGLIKKDLYLSSDQYTSLSSGTKKVYANLLGLKLGLEIIHVRNA